MRGAVLAFVFVFLGMSFISAAAEWVPTWPPPGVGDSQWVQASGHDCGADLLVYVSDYTTETLTWNTYISHLGNDPHSFQGTCADDKGPDSEASLEWKTTSTDGPGTVHFYIGLNCTSTKGTGTLLVNRSQYSGSLEIGTDCLLDVGGSSDSGNSPLGRNREEILSNARPSYSVDLGDQGSVPWEVQITVSTQALPDIRLDTMAYSWIVWSATNAPCIYGPPADHSLHAPTANLDGYWVYTLTQPWFTY